MSHIHVNDIRDHPVVNQNHALQGYTNNEKDDRRDPRAACLAITETPLQRCIEKAIAIVLERQPNPYYCTTSPVLPKIRFVSSLNIMSGPKRSHLPSGPYFHLL